MDLGDDLGDQLDAVAAITAGEATIQPVLRRDDELAVVGAVVDGAVSTELIAELPETDIEHRCDGIEGDMG